MVTINTEFVLLVITPSAGVLATEEPKRINLLKPLNSSDPKISSQKAGNITRSTFIRS
jgi:hypothetical protein